MAEDWNAIAAEVDQAIRSVGDISQPDGFPATLRRAGEPSGSPYDPTPGTPTYTTLRVLDRNEAVRDAAGTLVGETRRTLTVGTDAGVVPSKADKIAVGITAEEATEGSAWHEIAEVRPLAPAGVAVLYEIDLVT